MNKNINNRIVLESKYENYAKIVPTYYFEPCKSITFGWIIKIINADILNFKSN